MTVLMAFQFSLWRLLIPTLILATCAAPEGAPLRSHHSRRHKALVVSSIVAVSVIFCLLLCFLYVWYNKRRQRRQRKRMEFLEGVFQRSQQNTVRLRRVKLGTVQGEGQADKYSKQSLETATDKFNADNIIGSGNISTVYKGVDSIFPFIRVETQDFLIAVKILNIESSPQLEHFLSSDINVLSRICHRNLVKVMGSSWPGEQFVALVTKFVPNGNLDTAIHAVQEPLDLTKRLNIIITTAQTLVYLHNLCDSSIVHCHLRPTNILLDKGFEVRVSDYGTAVILWSHLQQESKAASDGAIGYIAPEIAVNDALQVSPKVDVYSFGVILMEMMTRRRPTVGLVPEGGERINLRQWIEAGINAGSVVALVDPALAENMPERQGEKMINLLKLSLLCTKEIPDERPSMSQVLSWLVNIRQDRIDCDFGF